MFTIPVGGNRQYNSPQIALHSQMCHPGVTVQEQMSLCLMYFCSMLGLQNLSTVDWVSNSMQLGGLPAFSCRLHNRGCQFISKRSSQKNSQNSASCKNFRIDQSAHSIFDYPKMPRFSKKANLVKELESVIQVRTLKAYLRFYLDAEDRFEDELDYYLLMKLALLKSQRYAFRSPYRTWNSSWERMLYDGMYMTETEFLSNFRMDRACIHQLTELIKDDEVFSKCWGKRDKRPVVLHIMVFLRYLGSYGNEASLQKIGLTMGMSKGAVNDVSFGYCKLF
jgi:hypothetical protein